MSQSKQVHSYTERSKRSVVVYNHLINSHYINNDLTNMLY